MSKPKLMELFKGTGIVGEIATELGYEVTSLDSNPIYEPNIVVDILTWDYESYSKENKYVPDYIWASPPGKTFSSLAYKLKERNTENAVPYSDRAKNGTKILYKTLEIIDYFKKLNPNLLYCIENPRGMMRKDSKMTKHQFVDATYLCYYGNDKLMPTNFWSNYPLKLIPIQGFCKKYTPVTDINKMNEKYKIPPKLIKQIIFDAL